MFKDVIIKLAVPYNLLTQPERREQARIDARRDRTWADVHASQQAKQEKRKYEEQGVRMTGFGFFE